MAKKIKPFNYCWKGQLYHNHFITMIEFMYPDVIKRYLSNQTKHFNEWRDLSTLTEILIKKGFSGDTVVKIITAFEKTYFIKNPAEKLNINYETIEELYALCIENGYGIISANDFYYPYGDTMKSVNGYPIKGLIFLVGQE